MSNVKGNDIDDLFKRAADKYPLRTDSADWNKLAADLDKDRSLLLPPANVGGGDKRKRRRFFWLFLLLPLGGIGYYAVQSSRQSQAAAQHGVAQTPGTDAASGKGSNPEDAASAGTPSAESTGKAPATIGTSSAEPGKKAVPDKSGDKVTSEESEKNTPGTASGKNTPAIESTGKAPATAHSGTIASGAAARITPAPPASIHSAERKTRSDGKNNTNENADKGGERTSKGKTINRQLTKRPSTEGQITGKRRTKGRSNGQPGTGEERMVNGMKQKNGFAPADRDVSLSALKSPRALTTGSVDLQVTVTAKNNPVAAKDSSGVKMNIPAKNKKESFFYAGLIVAPDLSTVKMQSVKGVGTTYGVLLGYQFNKRWAVETGAYLDHKKYYTEGEYFKGASSSSTYKVLTVNGYCNMWEIPINVRYNLSLGPKTKWFATAGLSTYLMTRENYVSKIQTSTWTYDSPWDIKKPSQYWFSVVNLSVGFEQKLGKIGNLRLEPYLRIPLKGMGTGSLPIMSAGLNIGITRRIW